MQEIEKSLKKIEDLISKIGICPIDKVPITCNEIANIDLKSLLLTDLGNFEDFINKVCSYNIYLKSQKGLLESQIEITERELNKSLYLETNNLGEKYKYKNIEEKIAVIRTMNLNIDDAIRNLSILKSKLARIKDIPFAIDKKIEILRLIYNRRLSSERKYQ